MERAVLVCGAASKRKDGFDGVVCQGYAEPALVSAHGGRDSTNVRLLREKNDRPLSLVVGYSFARYTLDVQEPPQRHRSLNAVGTLNALGVVCRHTDRAVSYTH